MKKQKPILGVIYVPCTNELYYALEGLGAFKAKIDSFYEGLESLLNNSSKLPVNKNRSNFIVVGSRSHMSNETQKYFDKKKNEYDSVKVLAVGSSLKICMVAEGKADVYPRYAPTMEWDTAAGHAIANMAGFKIIKYNSCNEIIVQSCVFYCHSTNTLWGNSSYWSHITGSAGLPIHAKQYRSCFFWWKFPC